MTFSEIDTLEIKIWQCLYCDSFVKQWWINFELSLKFDGVVLESFFGSKIPETTERLDLQKQPPRGVLSLKFQK